MCLKSSSTSMQQTHHATHALKLTGSLGLGSLNSLFPNKYSSCWHFQRALIEAKLLNL
jgi:hypothetical protein